MVEWTASQAVEAWSPARLAVLLELTLSVAKASILNTSYPPPLSLPEYASEEVEVETKDRIPEP